MNILIAAGATVNMKDQLGWTPLLWASANGKGEVVETLLKSGANVNEKDFEGVFTSET